MVENLHLADEEHDYGPSKRAAAYKFLARHLSLDIAKISDAVRFCGVDESGAVIEKKELMIVFDAAHPLPGNALKSDDAITSALQKKTQK
jgi:hypothetical protein